MEQETENKTNEEIVEDEVETEEISEEETEETAEEPEEVPETEEEKLQKEVDALKERVLRNAAEFDNFKKRTAKERDELYAMAVCDTMEKVLPIKDNLERALTTMADADKESIVEGVQMIQKQFDEVLKNTGVEKIESVGEIFNPEFHNAVMHEENDDFEENTICEEFMTGYKYKDKVIRHSMVKVAN